MNHRIIKKRADTGARLFQAMFAFVFIFSLLGVQPTAPAMAEPLEAPSAQGGAPTNFAIISDYGYTNDTIVANVANMVNSWDPDFIVTAGDNNQGSSCLATTCYPNVVGAYYGPEAVANGRKNYMDPVNFYPAPGNHDYSSPISEYQKYFNYLPDSSGGNAPLYYEFVRGPVHFFMMNSEASDLNSQKAWLELELKASTAPWKIVVFHRPAYTGGYAGSNTSMQWPFAEWGADFVFAAHVHIYERIPKMQGPNNDIPIVYYTSGVAGSFIRTGNQIGDYYYSGAGAMRLEATTTSMKIEYVPVSTGEAIDSQTYTREAPAAYAWEAFVDCAYSTSHTANPTNTLVKDCSLDSGVINNVPLVNFADGSPLNAKMTVTVSDPAVFYNTASDGSLADAGTDAYEMFGKPGEDNYKANMVGNVIMQSSHSLLLTLSGLDPEKSYTFATTANRNNSGYTARRTTFTLAGAQSAINASSEQKGSSNTITKTAFIDGSSTTTFGTGYNTEEGYIAKWDNIVPDSNGEFTINFSKGGTDATSYGPAVFYLAEEIGDAETFTLTATDDGNGSVELSPPGGVYYENQTVTLTPKPNTGYAFSHWSGDNADDIVFSDGKHAIVMNENKSVTAHFEVTQCTTVNLITTGDTYLRQGYPKRNYGGTTTISMSDHTSTAQGALFKWDLSEIPADVIVDSASLSFYVTDASKTTFSLYNLKREWIEGTSNDAESTSSANWNTYDGENSWGTGGAASTTSDRDNINLWDATGGTGGTFSNDKDVTIPLNTAGIAVVQGWVDGNLPNYGLAVQNYTTTTKDYYIVASKENTSGYAKPTLNVTYCVATTDPTIITSVGTLEPFHTQPGMSSEAQTYTVTGVNLENNLIITAPEGFVLSSDGINYNSELEFVPSEEGTINKTVFVRLSGTNEGVFGGNITHTSIGAVQKDVAVSGSISSEICVTSRINLKSDDVEERMNTGSTNGAVDLDGDTSTKALQMYRAYGGSTTDLNWWGLRFQNVDVPEGATITSADITFRAIADSGATTSSMTLWGQADDSPVTFTTANFNVSSRAKTTASAAWSVPSWTAGSDYVTPDLADVIQEIVDRPGWAAKNAIAILGQTTVQQNRSATSFDSTNGASLAPQLEVCYTVVDPRNITKAVDKDEAEIGETLTYTISDVSYEKNDLLTNVSVTDAIPTGTTYVDNSATPAAMLDNGVLIWNLGSNTVGVPGEVTEDGGGPGVITKDGDVSTGKTSGSSTSLSFSHTTGSGDNRLLVVGVSYGYTSASSISSVKFDGLELTRAGTAVEQTNLTQVTIFYLVDPPALKTANIVVTAEKTYMVVGAINFAGVNLTSPVGVLESAKGKSSSPSVDVLTEVGDLVFDTVIRSGSSSTQTPGNGQTLQWNENSSSGASQIKGLASIKPATLTSTTMAWTLSGSTDWAIAALPIKPGPAISTRTTTLKTANSLVSAGDTVTVEAIFTNTLADTAVTAGALEYVLTGGILPEEVSCTPVGTTSGDISASSPLTVTYKCTVATEKIGSIAFKLDAESADNEYPEGLSNSVLIVPELSFQVTVDATAGDEIENVAMLNSSSFDSKESEPAVTTITEVEETPITSAAITVDEPAAGATPASTASLETDPTSAATVTSVSWNPGGSTFDYSTVYTVTVVLEAASGHAFTGSTSATVNGETADTVTLNGDGILTVTYEFPKTEAQAHTVTFDGNGATSGEMDPQTANAPTKLTKNAFEWTGYTFTGWNTVADGSGTPYADEATYDFDADLTLYAQWTINTYTLAINVSGNGSVSKSPDKVSYNYGEVVTLTATPYQGYSFLGWGGALDGDTNPVQLTIDANKVVEASFSSDTAPPFPSSFYGKILYIDGDGVPKIDDLVQAYLDDETDPICSTAITADAGQLVYAINVKAYPNGTLPTRVTFKINGRVVAITDWETGSHVELDFHPPKADAGGPYVTLLGAESIDLLGSVTDRGDDVESFAWALGGDGVFDDAAGNLQPSFAFSATGAYPVSLMAVDAQGGQGFGDSLVFVITVDGLTGHVYDGDPKSVSVSELTGYEIGVLYDGSPTAPKNAGSYPVTIQIKKDGVILAIYNAGTLVIAKATPTIITPPTATAITYGQTLADSALSGGEASVPGGFAWTYPSTIPELSDSGVTLFDVTFTPDDSANYNNATTQITLIVNQDLFTYEITLVAGWNLVSLPVTPLSTDIGDVLASINGKYTLVYAWDATGGSSGAGHWMRHAAGGYGDTLDSLDETQGFWIFMTEAATLKVTGKAPDQTEIPLTTTVGGWNLVGYPSSLTPTPPALMGEIDYTLIITYFAADTADPWKLYDPKATTYANDLVEMLPGYGYWIFVNQNATLEVPFK